MMSSQAKLGLAMAIGLLAGWLLARPGGRVEASRAGERDGSVFLSGPIAVQNHPTLKLPLPQDALYILDYRKGKLMASVPTFRQVGTSADKATVLGAFATRDLIADFQLPPGITPNFLMEVPSLGASSINAWAPLVVFETNTRRVASYRVAPQGSSAAGELAPRFDLLELKTLPE